MRKSLFYLLASLFVLSLPLRIFASENIVIKSLEVYSGSKETNFPVIFKGDRRHSRITIEFDVQADVTPELALVFKFCNSNFQPYPNVFLANDGKNIYSPLLLTKLNPQIRGAQYHFKGTFPNRDITFPFSGKWMFLVTAAYDTSEIYNYGYFYVAEQKFPLRVSLTKSRSEDEISDNTEYDRTAVLKVSFKIPVNLDPARVKFVEVVKNRMLLNSFIIPRSNYSKERFFEWNGSDEFTFIMKDLKPGNEYRELDFRNEKRYFGDNIGAQISHLDLSRFYEFGRKDLNGAEILTNYKSYYANYYYIPFSLRVPDNFNKHIYLVGSFTNWEILPDFEMGNNDGVYEIEVELKRGKYDYQYVTSERSFDKAENFDWIELEGNFWETRNDYHIFVFYDSQDLGGYDKIISATKIEGKIKESK